MFTCSVVAVFSPPLAFFCQLRNKMISRVGSYISIPETVTCSTPGTMYFWSPPDALNCRFQIELCLCQCTPRTHERNKPVRVWFHFDSAILPASGREGAHGASSDGKRGQPSGPTGVWGWEGLCSWSTL